MRFVAGRIIDGKPMTIAVWGFCAVMTLAIKSSAIYWTIGALEAIVALLNIYSWDYQNRHGWPDEDEEE